MKIVFDSNQQYQLDAIQAMVDTFDGQPLAQGEYEIRFDTTGGDMLTQLGVGNNLVLDESTILSNRHIPPGLGDCETGRPENLPGSRNEEHEEATRTP